MKWIRNPKWAWKNDVLYWLYYYPIEFLKALYGIITKDHILNEMDWKEYLDIAAAIADMKAGRLYTMVEDKWWECLDWSTMEGSFKRLSKSLQKEILKEGYWSLGKGKFET